MVLIPATSVSICAASDRMANEFDMYPPTISIQTKCVKNNNNNNNNNTKKIKKRDVKLKVVSTEY